MEFLAQNRKVNSNIAYHKFSFILYEYIRTRLLIMNSSDRLNCLVGDYCQRSKNYIQQLFVLRCFLAFRIQN